MPRVSPMTRSSAYLSAVSADFIIDLYHRYLRDPASVDAAWKPYFDDLYGDAGPQVTAARLIDAWRQRGHFAARLDPLGLWSPAEPPELSPGLDAAALDAPLAPPATVGRDCATLRA